MTTPASPADLRLAWVTALQHHDLSSARLGAPTAPVQDGPLGDRGTTVSRHLLAAETAWPTSRPRGESPRSGRRRGRTWPHEGLDPQPQARQHSPATLRTTGGGRHPRWNNKPALRCTVKTWCSAARASPHGETLQKSAGVCVPTRGPLSPPTAETAPGARRPQRQHARRSTRTAAHRCPSCEACHFECAAPSWQTIVNSPAAQVATSQAPRPTRCTATQIDR
mmetsp:Transcript_31679/g.72510  ORF Transcript_31679/g.72510 Transcript_31679/m.72510 type:complete len:223 (-) Transcript_31679:631-1299(-)